MCLLCCGSCAFLGYKTNKALDKSLGSTQDVEVESYWKTELKHSLKVRNIKSGSQPNDEHTSGSSRRMSAKEKESKERLQRLVDMHAPNKDRGK
jgi:hypothetical protein